LFTVMPANTASHLSTGYEPTHQTGKDGFILSEDQEKSRLELEQEEALVSKTFVETRKGDPNLIFNCIRTRHGMPSTRAKRICGESEDKDHHETQRAASI